MNTLRTLTHGGGIQKNLRVAVDIGAGTGIFTRQLANILDDTWSIIGIEPGEAMRREAIAAGNDFHVKYACGTAEQIPFAAGSIDLITVAQAAHWFNREMFYPETLRVLRNEGHLIIVQNNRDWLNSPFLNSYEDFLETYNAGYKRHARKVDYRQEMKDNGFLVDDVMRCNWAQPVSRSNFIGMVKSSNVANSIVQQRGIEFVERQVNRMWDAYGLGSTFICKYVTEMFVGRKGLEHMVHIA